jgi:peptidoglycan hydrolase CwlO-like protein
MLKNLLIVSMFLMPAAWAQPEGLLDVIEACDLALSECDQTIAAQQEQIQSLQVQLDEAYNELSKSEPPSAVPDWAIIGGAVFLGIGLGVAVGSSL